MTEKINRSRENIVCLPMIFSDVLLDCQPTMFLETEKLKLQVTVSHKTILHNITWAP